MDYDNRKITARIDLEKVNLVNDVELGANVEIKIVGKVSMLRGPEKGTRPKYDKEGSPTGKEIAYTYPGCLEVEISKISVDGYGDFSGMEDD